MTKIATRQCLHGNGGTDVSCGKQRALWEEENLESGSEQNLPGSKREEEGSASAPQARVCLVPRQRQTAPALASRESSYTGIALTYQTGISLVDIQSCSRRRESKSFLQNAPL